MNEHLNPVFEIILPQLQKEIPVWIIGGVSVAAIRGNYLRYNQDVDTFVLGIDDYNKSKQILKKLCKKHDWILKSYLPQNGKRPKMEIFEEGMLDKDIFSLMPVFQVNNEIEFIFPNNGSINFPRDILTPISRKINGYEFTTPSDIFIKKLFENHYNLLKRINHKGPHMTNYKTDQEFLDSFSI